MITTTSNIDVKTLLSEFVQRASQALIDDSKFIPDDKLAVSPMGCARTPLNFMAECAGFNIYVGKTLAGESVDRPAPEVREAFYASINTREKAAEAIRSSAEGILGALGKATEEDLSKETTAPWGATIPMYKLVHASAAHMMYHDGQINYIQCLYGDGENHWG